MRLKAGMKVVAAFAIAGCGGGDGSGGNCSPMEGAYLFQYDERSGNCGDSESIINVMPGEGLEGCDGTTRKPTPCDVEVEATCPFENDFGEHVGYFSMDSVLSQVDGPRRAEGMATITIYNLDRVPLCSGTGDLTYIKQ